MSEGITGDLQVNDTEYHRPLRLLTEKPKNIPSPKRNDMMLMISEAWS